MRRLRAESGNALATAIILTTVIVMTALGTMPFVDANQRSSGVERVKETSFNLGESLLNNDVLILANQWPNAAAKALPASCTSAATRCPDPTAVLAGMAGADLAQAPTWTVSVRDDLGSAATYYSKSATDTAACGGVAPCTWDSNGNGAVWVRADTTVRGRTRSLVALVRQQPIRMSLPRNTITAGYFQTANNGLKVIVDEKGCQAKHRPADGCNATDPAPVAVRCTSAGAGNSGDACLGYRSVQVAPAVTSQSFAGNVTTPTSLAQMKTYAIQLGTYFDASRGCPTVAQAAGPLVYVDGLNCSYTGSDINSSTSPGTFVINQGTLTLGGNVNFYGIVLASNNLSPPADAGNLVTLTGTAYIQGALYVEGRGGVRAGASGLNISFDPNVLGNVQVAGTPAIVQNSFRELPLGQ